MAESSHAVDSQSRSSSPTNKASLLPVMTASGQPALRVRAAIAPTALGCLQCQLIGKRKLTCTKADACADLPMSFALGPILLAAWAATAVAFVISIL